MKRGDLVYVNDSHPEFGYIGFGCFVKHLSFQDKHTGWKDYVYLLDSEPHCAVWIKGDKEASVFPTRCVTLKRKKNDNYE